MAKFIDELEAFRREEQSAQQFFLGYLALQRIPGRNPAVLKGLNESPTFWISARYALLVASFVAIGRIFDQDHRSVHNIDKLMQAMSHNIKILSQVGLRERRIADGMDPTFAAKYAAGKHDLTIRDIRELRKAVTHWRRIYDARYRDIRHWVFAHRGVGFADTDELMAKTNINELLEMLSFFEALHVSLWELHANGIKPNITPRPFALPPAHMSARSDAPGEIVYRQAMDLMFGRLV